jgi:hypothetical protein
MSIIIRGSQSNILADVDDNNNLKVNLPTTLSGSGYVIAVGEIDDGSVTGTKLLKQLDISQDYRLRVGVDKIIWQDTFSHTVINNSKYLAITSTMTMTNAGGFLNMNAGNSVTSGNVARLQTFKTFTLFNTYPLYVDFKAKFSFALQANSVIEFGLGYATGVADPTGGVFFRAIGGQLNAVICSNSQEVTTANIHIPVAGVVYHYAINIGQDACLFWANDILLCEIPTPIGFGAPTQSNALPLLVRQYNSGAVTNAIQFNIAQLGITLGDMDSGKDWDTVMATNGQNSIVAPDGQAAVAAGTYTANFVNNTVPATVVPANATSGYGPLILGGQFAFAALVSAETDLLLFSYLVPAGTAAIPGKSLIIRGVRIDTINTVVAVATTATVLQWSLGVGATAISLLTVDSVTAGTRAARRIGLGIQTFPVASTVGSAAVPIDVKFAAPIMCEAGTYAQIILKVPLGTATATEIFRGIVTFNGYFE